LDESIGMDLTFWTFAFALVWLKFCS